MLLNVEWIENHKDEINSDVCNVVNYVLCKYVFLILFGSLHDHEIKNNIMKLRLKLWQELKFSSRKRIFRKHARLHHELHLWLLERCRQSGASPTRKDEPCRGEIGC